MLSPSRLAFSNSRSVKFDYLREILYNIDVYINIPIYNDEIYCLSFSRLINLTATDWCCTLINSCYML